MSNSPWIPEKQFFRIGDVADLLGVKPYVLRYWETEFKVISPTKSPSGQRIYRRADVETLVMIKHLLYEEKFSISGARQRISVLRKEGGLKAFRSASAEAQAPIESERPGLRVENLERLRELTRELKLIARTPISRLFHL